MNTYYGQQQYGLPPQPPNQANGPDQSLDGIAMDAYVNKGRRGSQTGQMHGYPLHLKQESNEQNFHFNALSQHQHQQHQHGPRDQDQPMQLDQSGMMQFGNDPDNGQSRLSSADMTPFEFVPSNAMSSTGMRPDTLVQPGAGLFGPAHQSFLQGQGASDGGQQMGPGQGLSLINTYMNDQNTNNYNVASPSSSNPSPMMQNFPMTMSANSHYMPQNFQTGMKYASQNTSNVAKHGMNSTGHYNNFQQNQYPPANTANPRIHNAFPPNFDSHQSDNAWNHPQQVPRRQSYPANPPQQFDFSQDQAQSTQLDPSRRHTMAGGFQDIGIIPMQDHSAQHRGNQDDQGLSKQSQPTWQNPDSGFRSTTTANDRSTFRNQPQYTNAYSSTGMDLMGILSRVAYRKNPQINIGAVDGSCAFVVCDADQHDNPIVYCTDNFERLTGYNKHEILGRNCRFLQAPDGRVQAGVKREHVDDDAVLYLKNTIHAREEAQISLINYRKGGQPFMNLLTMIPIPWDGDEIKFFVGLQVDLVEQPYSVTTRNPDGTYQVNYQRGLDMPKYVFDPGANSRPQLETGQSVSRDDVSTVLSTIGSGESELSKRVFDKVVLENADDVIFVLSLKGLFLYLSPSSNKILEYDSSELVGSALSSVAHPSDIVPVTRELKDTASGVSVDIVFRIRRKHHGYMWFEGHGSLHTEQGKGRKSIVLVGRERPVYTLNKAELLNGGGICDNEIWSKLSTSGMFLFVAANVRQLLDRHPNDLIGTSIQAIMRPDSKPDFARILEVAKTGKRAQCKHDLINRKGQILQVHTIIYPGDATVGQKPTFVIAQSRLHKYSRPTAGLPRSQKPVPKFERTTSDGLANSQQPDGLSRAGSCSVAGTGTPNVNGLHSLNRFPTNHDSASAPTHAGQQGLRIGHQDYALASDENLFDELKTTRSTSWQFELRQMEKGNRLLAEEMQALLAARKKRKRRKTGAAERDCANCHTRTTPEWRRGPSGNRDLCNSCGLRWAKQQGRISPRTNKSHGSPSAGGSASPMSAAEQQSKPSPAGSTSSLPQQESNTLMRNTGIEQTLADTEDRSKIERRRSLDAASASRRSSGVFANGAAGNSAMTSELPPPTGRGRDTEIDQDYNDGGAHKVAKVEGSDEPPPLPEVGMHTYQQSEMHNEVQGAVQNLQPRIPHMPLSNPSYQDSQQHLEQKPPDPWPGDRDDTAMPDTRQDEPRSDHDHHYNQKSQLRRASAFQDDYRNDFRNERGAELDARYGDDDDEEPRSPYRHSGHPGQGTELPNSIAENMEGEERAEWDEREFT